jgi:hypothetical protein
MIMQTLYRDLHQQYLQYTVLGEPQTGLLHSKSLAFLTQSLLLIITH